MTEDQLQVLIAMMRGITYGMHFTTWGNCQAKTGGAKYEAEGAKGPRNKPGTEGANVKNYQSETESAKNEARTKGAKYEAVTEGANVKNYQAETGGAKYEAEGEKQSNFYEDRIETDFYQAETETRGKKPGRGRGSQ